MKKLYCIGLYGALFAVPAMASGEYSDRRFLGEVSHGMGIVGARSTTDITADADAAFCDFCEDANVRIISSTPMYIRMGGGLNLGKLTARARSDGEKYKSAWDSYTAQIGLGWNLSAHWRTELDLQSSVFKFDDLDDATATYYTGGAMLYFDFWRKYVVSGGVLHRRYVVPFVGLGASTGVYEFEGASGAHEFAGVIPTGNAGLNVRLTSLISLDIMYQYQMLLNSKFGWNTSERHNLGISNIMASVRVNF